MWELLLSVVIALSATTTVPPRPEPPPSLADLPRGQPPQVGYVDHGVWRGPGGRTVDVPDRHGVGAITPYDGGFFIADTRYFEGSIGMVRVDGTGRIFEAWASSGSAVVGPDGMAAWTSFVPLESGEAGRSLVHRIDRCGRETVQEWPGRAPFSVAGLIGEQVVVDGAFQLPVELLDPSGARSRLRLSGASDVSGRLVAGHLDPDGERSGVIDTESGALLWRTRAYGLTFSPSGRRVAGETRDGLTVFRTVDGRVLWRTEEPGRAHTGSPVWEDERHLLAVTHLQKEVSILRFAQGDEVERTTAVVRDHPYGTAYALTTR